MQMRVNVIAMIVVAEYVQYEKKTQDRDQEAALYVFVCGLCVCVSNLNLCG